MFKQVQITCLVGILWYLHEMKFPMSGADIQFVLSLRIMSHEKPHVDKIGLYFDIS
jgi:hypothetical protein